MAQFPTGYLRRKFADFLLLGVTSAELVVLFYLTPTFEAADWIYLSQSLVVLGVALTRRPPEARDYSLISSIAVVVSYAYPYAQIAWLRWEPGESAWQDGSLLAWLRWAPCDPARPDGKLFLVSLFMVTVAACLSLASLLTLGRSFGVRPALRRLATRGPYRVVRHPIYLAYVIADIGYNLREWNSGTVLLVVMGWASLIYRIYAEERMLSRDPGWLDYAASVRHRLIPGVW